MLATLNTVPVETMTNSTVHASSDPASAGYLDAMAALSAPRAPRCEALELVGGWSWLAGEAIELETASDLIALEILKGL